VRFGDETGALGGLGRGVRHAVEQSVPAGRQPAGLGQRASRRPGPGELLVDRGAHPQVGVERSRDPFQPLYGGTELLHRTAVATR
jgi:hypothetical protein